MDIGSVDVFTVIYSCYDRTCFYRHVSYCDKLTDWSSKSLYYKLLRIIEYYREYILIKVICTGK